MKLHVEGFGCQMDGYDWFVSTPVRNLKREATEDMKALRQIIAEHKKLQAENARLKVELAQQTAVIKQMLNLIDAYHSPDHPLRLQALALQPSPEVLNKVRADAERYRWLREACETKEGWEFLICDADGDVVLKLDAAIDEAIRKEKTE